VSEVIIILQWLIIGAFVFLYNRQLRENTELLNMMKEIVDIEKEAQGE